MSEGTSDAEFAKACQLVGEFLFHFARLEQAIDRGIGVLLSIEGGPNSVVTANMDFARKVSVLRSAENFIGATPDQERKKDLDSVFSAILALNDNRKIVAHSCFDTSKSGEVVFRRVVATKKLKVQDLIWSTADFQRLFAEADETAKQVERIVDEMKPYLPSLDFSDPRNSAYIGLI